MKRVPDESTQCLLLVGRHTYSKKPTHRIPAAVVGTPADPGTAVEVGNPAAEEGLAGMLPAAGRTGRYLVRE